MKLPIRFTFDPDKNIWVALLIVVPLIIILVVLIASLPIWCINQLFDLNIAYTGWNLFASFALVSLANLGD